MKPILKITVVVLIIIAITATWNLGIPYLLKPPISVGWIREITIRKEQAAAAAMSPKIAIVGGSGAHFGYSAQQISDLTGRPAVNLATHAGLGLEYILYRAKRSLNNGDWVVLAIEPQNLVQQDKAAPSDILSDLVIFSDLTFLLHTSWGKKLGILFGLTPFHAIQTYFIRKIPFTIPYFQGDTVSSYGDLTIDVSPYQSDFAREKLNAAKPFPSYSANSKNAPAALKDFLQWAAEHRIQVVEAWTPTLIQPDYSEERYKAFFKGVATWFSDEGAISLPDPSLFFLPREKMFDYEFHANEKGRKQASEALAKILCEHMKCKPMSSPSLRTAPQPL